MAKALKNPPEVGSNSPYQQLPYKVNSGLLASRPFALTPQTSSVAIPAIQTTPDTLIQGQQTERNRRKRARRRENKKIRKMAEGKSINAVLGTFGSIIEQAVPQDGDSADVEFKFKIPGTVLQMALASVAPVASLGQVNVEFSFTGEASREDGYIESRIGMSVGVKGEVEIPYLEQGLSTLASLSSSITAKGKTGTDVATLISYGLFRQSRETNTVPRELVDLMWGESGAANKWAALVERSIFGGDPEAQVEVAKALGLEAGADLGFGELGVGAEVTRTTTYNKESIGSQLGKENKAKDTKSWSGWFSSFVGRGAEASVGETQNSVSLSLAIEDIKLMSGASLSGEAGIEFTPKSGESPDFELELEAEGEISPSEMGEKDPEQAAANVDEIIGQTGSAIENLADAINVTAPSIALPCATNLQFIGEGFRSRGTAIYEGWKNTQPPQPSLPISGSEDKDSDSIFEAKHPIKVSYEYGSEEKKGNLKIDRVVGFEFKPFGAYVEVTGNKSRTFFSYEIPK